MIGHAFSSVMMSLLDLLGLLSEQLSGREADLVLNSVFSPGSFLHIRDTGARSLSGLL